MMLQPETRPISQEQLVAEVKGIYAGLVMVETKCIEVDNAQSPNHAPNMDKTLYSEQWQALIALHRTLLHEHHDFFLAGQHPSASRELRRLASKYAMPARMWRHGIHSLLELLLHDHHDFFLASQHLSTSREFYQLASKYAMPASMWRHGIHSFLDLLRHRLPWPPEHILALLYLAYSMMALLCETVPAFEDTWIECLGDLGRYSMAIEDDDTLDREIWTGISRHWYSKASDKSPTIGRLYHHLAILARPNVVQQLYYYTKSLCVPVPIVSARESTMTLFDRLRSHSNSGLTGNSRRRHLVYPDVLYIHSRLITVRQLAGASWPEAEPKYRRQENPHSRPRISVETPRHHGPEDSRNWDNWIPKLSISRPILDDIATPYPMHELPPRRKKTIFIWSCCCSPSVCEFPCEVLARIGVRESAAARPPRPRPPIPLWPICSTAFITILTPFLAIWSIQMGILRSLSESFSVLLHIMAKNLSNMSRHLEQLGNAGSGLRVL